MYRFVALVRGGASGAESEAQEAFYHCPIEVF